MNGNEIMNTTQAEEARAELAKAVAAHAEKVRAAMQRVGIVTLCTDAGNLRRGTYRSNVGSAAYLQWDDEDRPGNLLEGVLSEGPGPDGYYLHGDFNCWIPYPCETDVLHYADQAGEIVAALNAEIANITRGCNEAVKALETAGAISE